jgi:hypothetical protein
MVVANGEAISDILSDGTEIPSDAFATVRERQSVCLPAATFDRHIRRKRYPSAVSSLSIPLADTVRLPDVSFNCRAQENQQP